MHDPNQPSPDAASPQWPAVPNPPIHPDYAQQQPLHGHPAYPQQPMQAYPPYQQPPHHGHGYSGYPQMYVAPKNPALMLLASFFIPGLGSMLNGETGKGVGILIGYICSVFLIIAFIGILGVFGFWIWGMVDAYQGAQKWNARHGIIS